MVLLKDINDKGFTQLKGIRILLSLPPREKSKIEITPELQEQMNMEYASKMDNLEIYAVGESVTDLVVGQRVYVAVEDLKRGTFVTINNEQKLVVSSMSVAIVW